MANFVDMKDYEQKSYEWMTLMVKTTLEILNKKLVIVAVKLTAEILKQI